MKPKPSWASGLQCSGRAAAAGRSCEASKKCGNRPKSSRRPSRGVVPSKTFSEGSCEPQKLHFLVTLPSEG
eukprot:364677-Chlamydomonas_euryale.AAC.5